MMKLIRLILGKIILLLDAIFVPKSVSRTSDAQALINQRVIGLKIYQLLACPFCVKVRRALKRISIPVEYINIESDPRAAQELIELGGQDQVPCLRVPRSDGTFEWLYESDAIIDYFEKLAQS